MASAIVSGGSLLLVLVILASILGAVHGRERFAYVGGVALFVLVHVAGAPDALGATVAVIGIAAVLASTIPLLRQPV